MSVNRENEEVNAGTVELPGNMNETALEQLKKKYQASGEKVYIIENSISIDDDTVENFAFLFRKPKPASYDRYLKLINNSVSKASRAFIMDNIVEEMKGQISDTLEEYPAMSISLTEKLLKMLGLADTTTVKKL